LGTNLLQPWRIRAAAIGRSDLLFEPEFERISENGTRDSYFVNSPGSVDGHRASDGKWPRRRANGPAQL
jgi:hypothetical protein